MARMALKADVSVGPVRGSSRLGWMVGVKAVLDSRGMTVREGCATMRKR